MKATCAWCGKDLGYECKAGNEPDSCGARECERKLRYMAGAEDDRIRDLAERDGFERYRH